MVEPSSFLASDAKLTLSYFSNTVLSVPVHSPSSSATTMCASSPFPPAVLAESDVPGALSKKPWYSHLLSGVTTEALCELFEEAAPTELPVYLSVNVNEVLLAIEATFLSSLSGPRTKISPTATCVWNNVPKPASVLEPFTGCTLPVNVELNAF